MYRNAYQRGLLTVFFSGGSKPLRIWETRKQDGYITRFLDQDIKCMVLEIGGTNISTTYMICPKGKEVLGINLPFLVMVVKNLKKYFSFEVTILDETGTRRRFRVSNFQSSTQIFPLCTVMPLGLSDGWNQIQFNLAEFTKRAYKKQFVEVQKLKINANIRLRRIYFAEKLVPEDQLPPEYKLYFPLPSKVKKQFAEVEKNKENIPQQQVEVPTEQMAEAKPEELKSSKTKIIKEGSKASIKEGLSKSLSKAVLGEIPDGDIPPASKRTSATSAPAAAEDEVAGEEAMVEEKEVVDDTEGAVEGDTVAEIPAEPSEQPAEEPATNVPPADVPAQEESEPPALVEEAEAAPE